MQLTRPVSLIEHQLDNDVLQLYVDVDNVKDVLPVSLRWKAPHIMSRSGFCCEQLQHVNGARPVTGPVGPPDCLGLTADRSKQYEAATLLK